MAGKIDLKKLEFREQNKGSRVSQYINTAVMTLSIPIVLIGFIYLVVFFLLNSSYGPKILHSQLSTFLRGDYWADTMSTDPFLQTLTMTNVRLSEAGKQEAVIFAPRLEAKIPIVELFELSTSTLLIGRIKAYNAQVNLDFTHGELNILKVVLPYPWEPEPPTPPGSFTVFLSDLNVEHTDVHLIFDGFRIDLYDTDVDHYSIRTGGGVLEMISPPAAENGGKEAIIVRHGMLDFEPSMFSFPLSSVGDADEGLVMSGGPGSAGKLGYANQMMSRYLEQMLREDVSFHQPLGVKPDMRGHFMIPLRNTHVDNFNWHKNSFYIPAMHTGVGDGGYIEMTKAMMNVGPTQEDIDREAQSHHYVPSGLLPEESILWAAKLKMTMDVQDHILSYFFGKILHGDSQLTLNADMAGDLARVSGDIALDVPDFETFDVDVARVGLRARMDGQHFEIKSLEADTMLGGVAAKGFYEIMDGDFDFDLYAGKKPADGFDYIDPEFAERLDEGLTPLDLLPDGSIKKFNGLLGAHLNARSKDGVIAVSLPDKTSYKLDESVAGVRNISIRPGSSSSADVFTYANGIMESPAGVKIEMGRDYVHVKPGMRLNLSNIEELRADVVAHIEEPETYAEAFGIEDLKMGPLDVTASYSDCNGKSCGSMRLKTKDVSYMGMNVPVVDVDLALKDSILTSPRFMVQSDIATINASIRGELSPEALKNPMAIPFKTQVDIGNVDLEKLNIEAIQMLGLKGKGEGTLTMTGPAKKLEALLTYEMHNVEVMDIPIDTMRLRARYENDQVYVPMLSVWFDKAEIDEKEVARLDALQKKTEEETGKPLKRPLYMRSRDGVIRRAADFSINTLTYDVKTEFASFNTYLNPISPNKFKAFRDLELPVEGLVSFDISGNADLNLIMNWFSSRKLSSKALKNLQSTWLEGEIKLHDVKYADLNLGNTEILMSRSRQFSLVKGNIIDLLYLSGFVRTSPNFSVSMSVNFPDLDVLQAVSQLGLDFSELTAQWGINKAEISGSVGFCMTDFEHMQVSVLLDNMDVSVLGSNAVLTQPARLRANLNDMSVELSSLELKYRDSVLKMRGNGDLKGNIDVDVNGEIDAAIAKSLVPALQKTTGLLGVSISAKGNIYHQQRLSPRNLDIKGYLGVRDPIQMLTSMVDSPVELTQGFLLIDRNNPACGTGTLCAYTPDDQPFKLGVNGQWITLSVLASSKGNVAANLNGTIDAALSQLFVKDIASATGKLDLNASVSGSIIDKRGAFAFDPSKFDFNAKLEVVEPIDVEMHTLNDPITLDDGLLLVTKGTPCSGNGECIVIPKSRPFKGNMMGGNYMIFGEIKRDALIPKSGNLSITGNNVGFRMKDELFLTLSPDIQITAGDFADFDTIVVAGDVDIAEARYSRNFDDGSSNFIRDQIVSLFIDSRRRVETYSPSFLRKMPQVGKIHLDIGMTAENSISADVRIATATLELEVGAQLRIGGTIKDFYPTGIVSISSGLFGFRGNDFEFQNGAQITFNGSLDGKIDIIATTEINTDSSAFNAVTGNTDLDRRKRISTSNSNTSDMYAITLTVAGTVFKPLWSFDSSPYLTDTNIYALILTGRTIEDFSGNDVAMESLLSPFFSSQIDTFINADQFKFVFSEGAAQFVYVKQINKGLRIAAGVSIRGSDGNEQALSAEYYFNDNWFVDLTGQNTSDEEGRAPTFKLGARLHWHLLLE